MRKNVFSMLFVLVFPCFFLLGFHSRAEANEGVEDEFIPVELMGEEYLLLFQEKGEEIGVPEDGDEDSFFDAPLSYVVEVIEEASFSGGTSGRIYYDSDATGWMCNSGSPGIFPDFIVETMIPGSYNNRSSLKVRGINLYASCYLSSHPARVYNNNLVRMCLGFWSVQFCGAVIPYPSEIKTAVVR